MAWLLLLIGLAVLRVDSTTQVLQEGKEMEGISEEDIKKEIILGIRAVEPPQDKENTMDIEPDMRLLSRDTQVPGHAADQLAPLASQSSAEPEEDRDHIHHPPQEVLEEEAPMWVAAPHAEPVSGPEEDRDHLYHA